MNGDIKLTAPGGRPGDIWLGDSTNSSSFTITGKVVSIDGTPRDEVEVTVFERRSLTVDVRIAAGITDARGGYSISFSLPTASISDAFVRAVDSGASETVDSALLSELRAGRRTVDLVMGEGRYVGRTEWDRIVAKLDSFLGDVEPQDIPSDRLEWLSTKADVFPLHLAAYVQAHRLAEGRTVKPETCYACIRGGLPGDLVGLLRAGEGAWTNALRGAWSQQILPLPGDGTPEDLELEVTEEVDALRELLVDFAVAVPESGVNQRVIFDTAGLSEAQQRVFAELWINRTGTLEEFWTDVAGSSLSAEVPLLKFTIQAGIVAGRHVETLEALQAERVATSISTVADTAAWSVAAWDAVLVARSVTPPDDVPGADATEKRQNYARALFNIIEDGHPSLSLRHSLDREGTLPPNTAFLETFLTNNPDFDIVGSTVSVYLDGAASPWAGIDPGDQAQARKNLDLVQRVYRLTPRIGRYASTKVLLEQGITSAAMVVESTKEEFVEAIAPEFSDADHHAIGLAEAVWEKAAKTHSLALGLISTLVWGKGGADSLSLLGIGGAALEGNGLGDLAEIIGSLDHCACEQCRSVFSPAAYLADLLKFLKDRKALDELIARRPDIIHILLDCDNTNTVLPYIDLVNELLEAYVLSEGELPTEAEAWHQTTWTADELRLHPEHLAAAAYDTPPPVEFEVNTTTFVHPWTLPFSLPTIEAQTYLRHLGVPRHEVMRRYFPTGDGANAIAADVLGLSDIEFVIVRGAYEGNESEDGREFWGFSSGSESDDWVAILAGTAVDEENPELDGDVGKLLTRGGFTFDQLRELLELDFINPEGDIIVHYGETCDLVDVWLEALDDAALDRIHRFTRLQRVTKIPVRMLNVLIMDALGGTIDQESLRYLADIITLRARLGLEWDVLATFWADVIDAREYSTGKQALYRRQFLAKDLTGDGDEEATFIPTGGTLAGEEDPPVAITPEQLPRVLSGIGAREVEYSALVGSELIVNVLIGSEWFGVFSFANLTAMFRSVQLARALRLSVGELARLAGESALTGELPFTNPAQTLRFVGFVDAIRDSGLSIRELEWVLHHEFETDPLDEAAIGRDLAELARGLNTIEAEATLLEDPDGVGLLANLPELLDDDDVATVIALVNRTPPLEELEEEEDRVAFIAATFAYILDLEETVDIEEANLVLAVWVDNPLWEHVSARRSWLCGRIVAHLRRRALVHDTIARVFGVPASVAEALVSNVMVDAVLVPSVLTDPSSSDPLFEVYRLPFANEEEIALGLTSATKAPEFAGWTRLAKAALLCKAFALRADEARWYSGQFPPPALTNFLDLDALPLNTDDPDASFLEWNALRVALKLRDLSKPGEIAFAQIALAADFDAALDILADHTGWEREMLEEIAETLGYSEPVHLADGTAVTRLRVLYETAAQFGVPVNAPFGWVGTPTTAIAGAIKLAARAKVGEDRWPDVAVPLRDSIRERQRDALLDAAKAVNPTEFRTSNDVFEHLLIDVEMSHCMMTSRIKQAITAVQIFIHRIFLHLESVRFGTQAAQRWEWMKNYRVWEANRKVFLYPENWIEPELRGNKTPEYEALEAVLMQGNLETARVEKGLSMYLDRLDRVSSLEIMGVYQWGLDVWLLGRTHSAPYEWFIRQKTSRGSWSVWEEVPVDIEGDAVALFVSGGSVHIFWATAQDRQHSLRPVKDFWSGEHQEVMLVYGEPIAGVIYQISHVSRSASREWSKPVISEPSGLLVRFGQRAHVHLWDFTPDEVRIAIMSEFDFPFVGPFNQGSALCAQASFSFSLTEHQTYYLGSNFSGSPLVSNVDVYLSAVDVELHEALVHNLLWNPDQIKVKTLSVSYFVAAKIGKLAEYSLRGSRYEHTQYRAELGHVEVYDHPIGLWDELAPTLFQRASKNGVPSFVLPATFWWGPLKFTKPHVYDDRKRKYLLFRQELHEGAGDGTSPDPENDFASDSYYVCPPTGPVAPLELSSPRELTQRGSDRVSERGSFSGGVPELSGDNGTMGQILLSQSVSLANENAEPNAAAGDVGTGQYALAAEALYHPLAKPMIRALAVEHLSGLYPTAQSADLFRQSLVPAIPVEEALGSYIDLPDEVFDFDYDSCYGIYNWELFYHVPMLIAGKLAAEQRWDEAQKWYHYIFNPIDQIDEDGPSRFWRLKPFVDQAEWVAQDQIEGMLGIGVSDDEQDILVKKFEEQVKEWAFNPFDPHAIARIRPGVYQRALLRKYYDNLIAWADHLFGRDTMESIAEATVLYILLAQLLGPKPQRLPAPDITAKSFDDLQDGLDAFSNAIVQLEGFSSQPPDAVKKQGCPDDTLSFAPPKFTILSNFWYFCYPPNPELLKYWDLLDDRLFKIRHCQNIEGIERQLPLFEPPIDPALLVAATAAGIDIQSVLAELNSGLPPYRFRGVHARATGFTASIKALGSALLSALEKRDGEELALLRSTHEREMLARVREVRTAQASDARSSLSSLEASRVMAEGRRDHYSALLNEGLIEAEDRQFDMSSKAASKRRAAGGCQIVGGVLGLIPTWEMGFSGITSGFGGLQLANSMNAIASVFSLQAGEFDFQASKANLQGSFVRRAEDWTLQLSQAQQEIARIDRDIIGAKIRVQIAERELDNHDLQVAQTREVDMWMHSKFTNQQLYNWMVGQLSTLYFQTYQLAFDLAKRAERAYRHELAIDSAASPIIKYGYWDSLRKGLLAGERLGHDLERLELAYMDRDKREFELRKSISLAELNPSAVQDLRETGSCDFTVPEWAFDLDHPGHYLRRIRAVRLTIPAVVGPHTTLGARLQLNSHRTRFEPETDPEGSYAEVEADGRFWYGTGAGQAVATSTAVQDAGVFNLDFKDERYLPFEYSGAVSSWSLSLPTALQQFDYRTIEDVVVHIDYTARDGGSSTRASCEAVLLTAVEAVLEGEALAQVFAVHETFPNEWEQFFAVDAEDDHVLTLPVSEDHFPYFARRAGVKVVRVDFALLLGDGVATVANIPAAFDLESDPVTRDFDQVEATPVMKVNFTPDAEESPQTMRLTIAHSAVPNALREVADGPFDPTKAVGMYMLVRYELV